MSDTAIGTILETLLTTRQVYDILELKVDVENEQREGRTMNTATRSQYKIWRHQKGRSLKRWLTEEKVSYYKEKFPHWRWQKIQVENRSYQASLQARSSQVASSYGYGWGRHTAELIDKKRNSPQYGGPPVISYDDILDVQLALNKGRI